ncbi:MAG: hypothetical protein PUK18_02715 [Firmicutes bacterium]|nr:hypothetical protein [Bacillota bacterium]MDY6159354.1 hypothetical protein [Candidatus Faecousia sp.]
MEDGSVVISILGDRKHIAKEMEATRKDIEKTEKKLAEKVSEKSGIEASLDDAMKAASATNEKIKALKREYNDLNRVMADKNTSAADYGRAVTRQAAITNELQLQTPILKAQDAEADRLHGKYEAASAEVERLTSKLAIAKEKAKDLASQEEQAKVGDAVRKQLDKASESAERFQKRMLRIGRNALLYNIMSSTLHNAVSYFGQLLNTNKEYQAELAKLKGALVNAFQPLYAQILPWAVSLLRILTSIVQVVGNFLSLLFGVGTLGDGEKSTGMLKSQAAAISGVGAAAKEAGKQLASFDQINKLGGNNSSGGGGGAGGGVSPDLSGLKSEEYQRELNRLTAILSGALLALGAILFFTGTNIPLGLALMAAGAIGLVNLSTGKWGEVTDELRNTLSIIYGILAGSFLAIGAILLFSGGPLNIARGIAMVAIGAAALVGLAYVNWNTIPDKLKETASAICVVGSIICVALGIVMLFTGRPGLGIGLILTGIGLLGAAAAVISWTYTPEKLKEIATEICVIGGIVFVATGIALLFTGHVGLGIGMILAGAAFLGAAAAINWGSLIAPLSRGAKAICKLGGAVMLAVGMALLFSGAGIPLGLGLIVAGLASNKLAEAIPWNGDAATKDLMDTINSVTAVSGALLTAVGLVLLFSGAGIPLGLGLLAAGAGLLWSSYSTDYDDSDITSKILSTEEKMAQSAAVKSAVSQSAGGDVSASQIVNDVMAAYDEMGMSGEMLYQYLSQDIGLADDDIESLGFMIGRYGGEAYITGMADGAKYSQKNVSSLLSSNLITSVDDLWMEVMFNGKDPEDAQHEINRRIVGLLKSGLLTPADIAEVFSRQDMQDQLGDLGLSFSDGYVKGMADGETDVEEEARTLTQKALDAIAEAQDSHSPSKKTASLAKDAVDGYVNELAASDGRVRTAGQTMVDSLTDGILSRTSVLDVALAHIVESANAMATSVVSAVNVALEALTSVSYTGSSIRIPAPTLYSLSSTPLPKLATGAVIPPNAPFAAILGDQRSGTNIEAPLSTIQQAVSGVVRGDEQISLLKEQNRLLMAILERADVKLDGRSIAESTTSYQRQMSRASGGDGHGRI